MRRYCKRGHDKQKPHGILTKINNLGYLVSACAVCSRERCREYYRKRREKEAGVKERIREHPGL